MQKFVRQYEIVYIQNKKNLGYNAGNNVGIAKALKLGCDDILISNSDVRYYPNAIRRLQNYLKQHPQTGIVGPKITDRCGRVQKSCICRRTGLKEKYLVCTKANLFFRRSYKSYFGLDRDYNRIFRVYAVLGCCFMITRQCAQAVTPFDEYPLLYEEELMLGIRMEQAGYDTVYNPQAVVRHLHGGSTNYEKAAAFIQNVCSEIYYCRCYLQADKRKMFVLYVYRILLYLLRCIRFQDFRKNYRRFLKITGREWSKL